MSNNLQYVHAKVNTKSLLGRQALIGMLQESQRGSPTRSNSPFQEDAVQASPSKDGKKPENSFSFNNNIYNNFAPEHSIDYVKPKKRLLPRIDQKKIEMIQKLKRSGKIKSTGRSPVPLFLYEESNAQDHLYITKVTKHVPVAHDQQLQSDSSPRVTNQMGTTGSRFEQTSKQGRDSVMSPHLVAHQELQAMLNQGFRITDNRVSKADAVDAMHRSLDSFNKKNVRAPGEVNLTLPPGFGLKEPQKKERSPGASLMQVSSGSPHHQMLQNVSTDHNTIHHKYNTSQLTGNHAQGNVADAVQSGLSINNPGMDSLFQENSQQDHSLMIDNAANLNSMSLNHKFNMSHPRSPAENTIQSRDEFMQSQGFRSVVRETTHREINDMLRAAHPDVYEDQRKQKAEKLRQEQRKQSAFSERKDSFAQALRQNKWHAPVKKNQIFQRILDSSKEPKDQQVDLAIIAHQIMQFGAERDTGYDDQIAAQRAKGVQQYGTGSIRKQREAKMLEYHRQQQAEKKKQDLLMGVNNSDLNTTTDKLMTLNAEQLSHATMGVTDSFENGQDQQHKEVSTLLQGGEHDVTPTPNKSIPITTDLDATPPSDATKGGNPLGGILAKQKLETKVRSEFTMALLGKNNGGGFLNKTASPPLSPVNDTDTKKQSQRDLVNRSPDSSGFRQKAFVLPNIMTMNSDTALPQNEGTIDDVKIKPTLLARRRAKKLVGNRKGSMAMMGSMHRSSNMSFTTVSNTVHSMPRNGSMMLINEEDAQLNVGKIQDMLQQIEQMDKGLLKPGETMGNPFHTISGRHLTHNLGSGSGSRPIFNIPTGGTFKMTEPGRNVDLSKVSITSPIQVKAQLGMQRKPKQLQQRNSAGQNLSRTLQPQRNKRSKSRSPQKQDYLQNNVRLTDEEYIKQLFSPTPNLSSMLGSPRDDDQDAVDPAVAQEREDLKKTCDNNNEIIRQILKDTAQILQRPDSEARFLRQNVIPPEKLNKYQLRKFVGKTIQLNVGQLYQPLKFTFSEFYGDFNVYFSHRNKHPNEENGFEQKESNKKNVIFPIAQEHLSANMLRYPKNKVLYITLECVNDCAVSVQMTHNKKDAPDMTVASAYSSQAHMNYDQMASIPGSNGRLSGQSLYHRGDTVSQSTNSEDLTQKAAMTIDTLKLMLGGEDNKTLHAAKLNAIVKKKINYMIKEDLDVAKDFLDLVEILKSHKNHVHKSLKEDILKRQAARNQINEEIFVENQHEQQPDEEMIGDTAVAIDGFQTMFWQNDLYRMLKEGQLTKQQFNEMRGQQSKQRKKEIDEMARIRNLQAVTKKEHRAELQQKIVYNLNKAAADHEFVSKWNKAAKIYLACVNIKKAMDQKKEEARYMASVFWIVLKMKIRTSTKLKRNGPTPQERLRRTIKNSMNSLGSTVHLRSVTAEKLMLNVFQSLRMREQIKQYIIETGKWVRTIQERFRSYWQVRTQQIDFILRILQRERERMFISSIKEADPALKQVGMFASKVTDANLLRVATTYYQACQFTYEPIFFAWRNKIKQFRDQGLDDMTGGWHNAFMAPRGVKNMEEISYKIVYKKNSLKKFLEAASKTCMKRNKYYMNVIENAGSEGASNISQTRNSIESLPSVNSRGRSNKNNKKVMSEARTKSKLRKQNREYATLEDAINKQEEMFQATLIKDLKDCAYYPPRPAMKYFPTPQMSHQLLHQAMQLQHKNLDAPDTWRIQYDDPQSPQMKSSNKSKQYNIEDQKGRLGSKQVPVHSSYQGAATNTNDMGSVKTADILQQPERLNSRAQSRAKLNTGEDFNPIRIATADDGERKTPLESDHLASRTKLPQTASGINLASPVHSNAASSHNGDQPIEPVKSPQIEIDHASSIEKPSASATQPDQP